MPWMELSPMDQRVAFLAEQRRAAHIPRAGRSCCWIGCGRGTHAFTIGARRAPPAPTVERSGRGRSDHHRAE